MTKKLIALLMLAGFVATQCGCAAVVGGAAGAAAGHIAAKKAEQDEDKKDAHK